MNEKLILGGMNQRLIDVEKGRVFIVTTVQMSSIIL